MITPTVFRDPAGPYVRILEQAGLEVRFPPHEEYFGRPAAMIEMLRGVDAVLASTEPYTPEILANTKLRVIARCGVGFDSVDVVAATKNNMLVTITPGAVEVSVAEHTLALIFALFRDVIGRDREVRSGAWSRRGLPRLAGKTLGIVGLGRIGRAVAEIARGVGLKIIAHDPQPNVDYCRERGIRCCALDELLAASDIVSLHLPNMPATRNIIDEQALRRMKPSAVLINTGRGGLVDEDALVRVMRGGHLQSAALDVFAREPLPLDSELLTLPNVVLSTHTAGLDAQSQQDMPRIAAENVAQLYRGIWPEGCVVNHELRATWKWS
jgi:phosphoglycerate dehydrogenase-like enzyme